ncbi:MAG: HNH endonuclease, partial [Candidatus Edwardsbacteria bacterium]|jgi:putative restriction endonuclease|nr:HNH endonuclease [Candidatus Edwardsbacteria bacterium]
MHGYIGLTDPDWYTYLRECQKVDEVNFWQPHGGHTFRALKKGELFFFKLRAPFKAIAGFGFFERFENLPAWLAWDSFEQMNGAPDFETMIERIRRLRKEDGPAVRAGDFNIGCIMISAPVFFREDELVIPPDDWATTGIQKGKGYDLSIGEGKRVMDECLSRAHDSTHYWNIKSGDVGVVENRARYGDPIMIMPRKGQGLFSIEVRDAYNGACAITHEHSMPVLEAAHIKPYAQGGEHEVRNGVLLRRDIHSLYDRGYVTITPDYVFRVGKCLNDEFKNGKVYYSMDGAKIHLPKDSMQMPGKELLDWHFHEVYRG